MDTGMSRPSRWRRAVSLCTVLPARMAARTFSHSVRRSSGTMIRADPEALDVRGPVPEKLLEALVGVQDVAPFVDEHDGLGGILEKLSEKGPLRLQGLLGPLARGDVHHGALVVLDAALLA
jgi:hypothetical protein